MLTVMVGHMVSCESRHSCGEILAHSLLLSTKKQHEWRRLPFANQGEVKCVVFGSLEF